MVNAQPTLPVCLLFTDYSRLFGSNRDINNLHLSLVAAHRSYLIRYRLITADITVNITGHTKTRETDRL